MNENSDHLKQVQQRRLEKKQKMDKNKKVKECTGFFIDSINSDEDVEADITGPLGTEMYPPTIKASSVEDQSTTTFCLREKEDCLDWHSQLGEAKKISQLDTNSIGLPDKLPEDEKTCTEVFMRAFADGCSLNEDLSLAILKIKGVESVSRTFRKMSDGHWPVICIAPDEEKCTEIAKSGSADALTYEVVNVLNNFIEAKYYKTWSKEDMEKVIKIMRDNYPLKKSEFCAIPGEQVNMVYDAIENDSALTGNVQVQVHLNGEKYEHHYSIAPFHCTMPSRNEKLQRDLPQIPEAEPKLRAAGYQSTDKTFSQLPLLYSSDDPNAMHTLLRATLHFEDAQNLLEEMEGDESIKLQYFTTTQKGDQKETRSSGFLLGKSGLFAKQRVKKERDYSHAYVPLIARNSSSNTTVPFESHPFNVDISVLITDESEKKCSIEKAFQSSISCTWECGPPPDENGTVVFIKEGEMHELADEELKLELEMLFDGDIVTRIPCCTWKLKCESTVKKGDSGSPVFLQKMKEGSIHMYFLGGLISKELAFPIQFSLDIIRCELAICFVNELIAKFNRIQGDTRTNYLHEFKKYLHNLKSKQVLPQKMQMQFDDGGFVKCEISFCIEDHQSQK